MTTPTNYQELAQKLKPYIVQWKLQTSPTNITTTTTAPTIVPWSSINFAYSSIGDIANRSHNLLTNLSSDDHTQYVLSAGRGGFARVEAAFRVSDASDSQYGVDTVVHGTAATINAYNSSTLDYLDLYADAYQMYIRPGGSNTLSTIFGHDGSITSSSGQDVTDVLGNLRISNSGYSGSTSVKHQTLAAENDSFALLQSSVGDTIINSKSSHTLHLRNNNQDRFSLAGDLTWYSGAPSIRTDNYVSQLTGLYLSYSGAIDARYVYADQMHVKAFIADLEQALAGLQIIAKSVAVLALPFTVPYPGCDAYLTVEDLPSAPSMEVFEAGDIVNVRQFDRSGGSLDVTDCWVQVLSTVDLGNGTQRWYGLRTGTTTYTTITRVNSTSTLLTASATNTLNTPTSTAAQDVMLAQMVWAGAYTCTPPSGWVLLSSVSSSTITQALYARTYVGGDPSSWAFTFSGTTASSGTLHSFRGCLFATPIDDVAAQANTSSVNMVAPNLVAESAAGALVFFGGVAGNVRATPPSGMAEISDSGVNGTAAYMAWQLLSGGTGGNTGTHTATLASATANVGACVLLTPSYTAISSNAGAATPFDIITGKVIIPDYGVSGNGYAEVNAVDGIYASNAPYYQIVTWTTHPNSGKQLRLRMGNLSGITDAAFGSFSGKYGLYTDNAFLKGDFQSANGNVRIYQASGINVQESSVEAWAGNVDARILQWWPDVTDLTGVSSFAVGASKPASGGFAGYNLGGIELTPNGNVQAILNIIAHGAGIDNMASIELGGRSYTGSISPYITLGADDIDFVGRVGDGWKNLSFASGWANYTSGWQVAQYKKIGDDVEVRGLVKRTSGSSAIIGTLASGYRPSIAELTHGMTDTGMGRIDVATTGEITLSSGGVGFVEIKFRFSTA